MSVSLSGVSPTSQYPTVPDPGPFGPGQYGLPGNRYYATGGPVPVPVQVGVDYIGQITIPNVSWERTYMAGMWHTADWIVYHFNIEKKVLKEIEFCLYNSNNPRIGTPVDIFVKDPTTGFLPPARRSPMPPGPEWKPAGKTVTILGINWAKYKVTSPPISAATECLVGLRLTNGEPGPDPGTDRNVYVGWVKTYCG
jgi:hypothetical protein